LVRVDQDGNAGAGAKEWRDLHQSSFNGRKRILPRDQADRVLPLRDAAGRGGGDANESAPSQRQVELEAIAAGDDGTMQAGQAGELDHGIDDLLPV
jgi:hypothetical protein